MLTDCFYPLNHLPFISEKYLDEALLGEYHLPPEELPGEHTSRAVHADTTFANSNLAYDLEKKLNTTVRASLLRFAPHTLYNWHTDISPNNDRHCSINFLLNQVPNSMTLFRSYVRRLNYDIVECPYVLYRPMLFNTSKEHCIINNSNKYRYLMTVTLSKLKFEDAVEFFKTYTINEY